MEVKNKNMEEQINLEWFAYKLRPIFLECQTSKGGGLSKVCSGLE